MQTALSKVAKRTGGNGSHQSSLQTLPPLREMPASEAAEGQLLGSMIVDSAACIPAHINSISREEFFHEEMQIIFDAVKTLYERDGVNGVNAFLVRNELDRRGLLSKIGGVAYLQRVIETVTSSACIDHYIKIVRDNYEHRQVIVVAERLAKAGYDSGTSIVDAVRNAVEDLEEIGVGASGPRLPRVCASTYLEAPAPAPDQILADIFDRGDKVLLVGSSKIRKSFTLLQLGMSLAAGRDFLRWSVPKQRRVVCIQFEIQEHHFHRRVRRMAAGLGISPQDIGDRLQIVNGRGLGICGSAGIEAILNTIRPLAPDVILLDPLYKLLDGKENAAEDLKVALNQFDQMAEATGAAVVYVHHDAKGFAGDRDIRDRGAGSNVLGRDYDAGIILTPHATEPNIIVVETLLRNYAPKEPFAIQWIENAITGGYCFTSSDITPTKQTSVTARKRVDEPFETYLPIATDMVENGPMGIRDFKDQLRTKAGLTRDRADAFARWALLQPGALDVHEDRGPGKHIKWIGTPEQIAKLREKP